MRQWEKEQEEKKNNGGEAPKLGGAASAALLSPKDGIEVKNLDGEASQPEL